MMPVAQATLLSGEERESFVTTHPDAEAAFRETLTLARRAPFYATHLADVSVSSLGDLSRLPLTTKEHLRSASPWGMIAVPREEVWHYHESTGTTGDPIACWYRTGEFAAMGQAVARWLPEIVPGKIVLNRFPSFAPISFCFESTIQLRGGCHIPSGNLSWDVPFPRALDFLRTLRPQILAGLPLETFMLWELACKLGIDPARELDSLETAILAGAPLPPSMRRIIERDWKVKVREVYGSNETLFLGASCEQGTLHLETSLFVAEVLDPATLAPAKPGEPGILTVTHLGPKAMPLVRYFTRDVVRRVSCTCGRPEPAVELLGRQDDIVEYGSRRLYTTEILEAGYQLADRNHSRIFFVVIRPSGLLYRVEVESPRAGIDPATVAAVSETLGVPVQAEACRRGDLLDPTAFVRTPKVYKPGQISDWRGDGKKALNIMEALLQWPTFDLRTTLTVLGRVLRMNRRRRQLLRQEASRGTSRGASVQPIRWTSYR